MCILLYILCITFDSHLMFIILADSYDIVNCVAAFVPGHLKSNCIREMLKIVKPGKSSPLRLS